MSSDAASVPRVTAADLHLRDAVVQELEVRDVKHVVNRISVARAAPDLNRLLTALTRNAAVPEGAIGVEVSDGVVTLTGEVPSWRAREAAERAVARGPGVGQVDNRITVGDDGLTKVRVPVVRPQRIPRRGPRRSDDRCTWSRHVPVRRLPPSRSSSSSRADRG